MTLRWSKRVHYISSIFDDGTCACRNQHGGVPEPVHDMTLQRRSEFSEPYRPYGVNFCRRVILPRPHLSFVQEAIPESSGVVRSRRQKRYLRISLLPISAVNSCDASSRRLPFHPRGNESAPGIFPDGIIPGLLSSSNRYVSTAAIFGSSVTSAVRVQVLAQKGPGHGPTCLISRAV